MNRQQLLKKISDSWGALKQSYDGLQEAQMTEAGAMGEWSVKDVLAHVTTWEEESLKALPLIIRGVKPPRYTPYGGIDGFNAQTTAQKRSLSLSDVLKQMDQVHSRLIDYLQTVREEQFERDTPFRHRLRLDTYSHYPMHAKSIREWRERSGAL